MAPILLIHGAWHGAWCWDKLLPELAARGASATAIDLPGSGDDPAPISDVTMDAYVERIVSALAEFNRPALLVGHSMAGMSIAAAAQLAHDRIAGLVYLAAVIPQDGDSMLSLVSRPDGHGANARIVISRDGRTVDYEEDALRDSFYADCSGDDVRFAIQRIKSQAMEPLAAPIAITDPAASAIPRFYIETLQDRSLPIEHQRAFAATARPIEVHTLDTSHSPFFAAPAQLADVLAFIAAHATVATPSQ